MTDLQGQSCLSQRRSCKGDLVKPRRFRTRDLAQFMRSTAPTYGRNGLHKQETLGNVERLPSSFGKDVDNLR